jgi:hypothetical protein
VSRKTTPREDWPAANRRVLAAALGRVGALLERHAARDEDGEPPDAMPAPAEPDLETSALARVVELFELSPFERDVLVLAAGMELDATFGVLCSRAQGDPALAHPTFGLALAALSEADWSALAPTASLRAWRLVELGTGAFLTTRPLRIDERVLHYLNGVPTVDERLEALGAPAPVADELVPSHARVADEIAAAWARTAGTPRLPVVQLTGADAAGKRGVAAAAAELLDLRLSVLRAEALPAAAEELAELVRLWEREGALTGAALLLDADQVEASDAAREAVLSTVVDAVRAPLLVTTRERRIARQRPVLTYEVEKPRPAEQRAVWEEALGERAGELDDAVADLTAQFDLSATTIRAAHAGALGRLAAAAAEEGGGDEGEEAAEAAEPAAEDLAAALWDSSRLQARPRLEDLAQRIEPAAAWDDLVLPARARQALADVVAHVRHRSHVYGRWGFAGRGSRGLGIGVLFSGLSGTGKTMAAEVLAGELSLDLFRIDLAAVVSKYIGETEKNLRRVFDAAEEGGAVLLFDEADALFGKRSEVRDSHDRHANIEVSYLLQRMESYRGLAVLTTNLRDALDEAFLRRLRFVVEFPFPDAGQRMEIWRRVFPPETPTEGLDLQRLARLALAGGSIRNIALSAAFLAAEEGAPVRMGHLLRAVHSEFAKLDRPLPEAEVRDWQ